MLAQIRGGGDQFGGLDLNVGAERHRGHLFALLHWVASAVKEPSVPVIPLFIRQDVGTHDRG
jgi:hypothetical protein